jgi:hypothetical protein
MEASRTDYEQLGVSASDDLAHITRAYKKLAKKFHPDISLLPKSEAEEKFKAISQAYRLIRLAKTSPGKPELYTGTTHTASDGPASATGSPDIAQAEAQWTIICARHPKARYLYDQLSRVSTTLSEEFRHAVLYDDSIEGLEEVASILEEEYLIRYFGPIHDIQHLAKWLIIGGHTAAAIELNGIVVAASLPKNTARFVKEFVRKHGLNYAAPAYTDTDRRDTIDYLLDLSREVGFLGSFFLISIIMSFVAGVLAASFLVDIHVDRGILLICSEVFLSCLVILIIMSSMLVWRPRRHRSRA